MDINQRIVIFDTLLPFLLEYKKNRTEDLWGTLVTRCHYYLCSCCDWLYNIIAAVSFFFPLLHRKCTEIHSYLILSCENYVYFYPPYSMESIIRLGCLTLLDAGFLRYVLYRVGGTLYWNRFCIVIRGWYSQNDRFVQNWHQGLLWYHIRSEKSSAVYIVEQLILQTIYV